MPTFLFAQTRDINVYSTQTDRAFDLPNNVRTANRGGRDSTVFIALTKQWLANQAYLDASVDSVSTTSESIDIYVREGCRYTLGDLSIKVSGHNETPDRIADFNSSKYIGRLFTESIVQDISNDRLSDYEAQGFYLSEFRISAITKDSSDCQVNLKVNIVPGDKIRVDGVRFTGVQRNSVVYIRRVSGIADGELLTPSLMERGRQNLVNSGLFEDVSDGELVFVDGTPFLLYDVSEQQLNFFDGLIGYQPDPTGSATIAGYGDILLRNSIANGNVLDLRYEQLQPLVSKLNLSAEQHYLGGLPLHIGGGLKFTQQDSSYLVRDFTLRGGYRIFSGFEITGTLRAERSSVAESDAATVAIDSRANFYGVGFHLRNINRYRVPTRGFEGRIILERGRRFINDERYQSDTGRSFSQTILRSMARGYILLGSRQVLAPQVNAMFLESPHYIITDLFRFGGANSLRGFREDQFRGSSVIWGELEGRYMLERNSYIFLFGAYGFYERPQLINEESDALAIKDTLTSLGFGLAFESPLGIIKFSYAVSPNEDLANGNVHVGIRAGL
ncbi:BamA/TamA family outer membrane protein [Rhodohalobacter sp. 8-1]|uniref:BamA/TamA family outer membrane protein n=1 Tax=Rhodohalobacter sp. 8-1 TaxID=3131972 RepID=UPI0030EF8378